MNTRAWLAYNEKYGVYGMAINITDGNRSKYVRASDIPPEAMKIIIESFNKDYQKIEASRMETKEREAGA